MPENSAINWMRASTQADLERGIADHLAPPAAVRGLSLEPLLGPIDLGPDGYFMLEGAHCLNWVIVGCESGPERRLSANEIDSHFYKASYLVERWMSWLRSIIDQCDAAGVLVFVKQIPVADESTVGWRVSKDPGEWPEWARRREYGRNQTRSGEMKIKYKVDSMASTWSYFDTKTDKLTCVSNFGRGEVALCFSEDTEHEFAKIVLHHGSKERRSSAVFADAWELGKEITRRWNAGAKDRYDRERRDKLREV